MSALMDWMLSEPEIVLAVALANGSPDMRVTWDDAKETFTLTFYEKNTFNVYTSAEIPADVTASMCRSMIEWAQKRKKAVSEAEPLPSAQDKAQGA